MVCARCIHIIEEIFNEIEIRPESVNLGEVDLGEKELSSEDLANIQKKIQPLGFEILNDKNSIVIENIKNAIIEQIHHSDEFSQLKVSEYLSRKLNSDYSSLSRLFSSIEGVTIEQFQISQKVEKVKELLVYDELSLTEISYRLGYSSLAHLSKQFKKVTGLTPSHFKELKDARSRKSIDDV